MPRLAASVRYPDRSPCAETSQAPAPPSYAAAKSALVSFTRSWALELAAGGITVNAVSPGPTETALFRANNPVEAVPADPRLQSIRAARPLRRVALL
ncbi:SDR family oxidoreductase [Rhizobium sp. LjRoot30]|jgi:NAD(P)-dependent dehydrogenase (short-subunit alcohol dehydrogenase family)|uniref:SDR family oxidoreductase n=1 Tax=Rhizobium sp. LjRoot30 TaxID=3342320 RepID=UPI003F4FEA83